MAQTQRSKSVARSARRERNRELPTEIPRRTTTRDAYQNFMTRTGMGTDNLNSYGSYGYYPITRLRIILDFAYRSSWICRTGVEAVAEDMTREGFTLGSDMDPTERGDIEAAFNEEFAIWDKLAETITWARLYGGAGAFIMIDGQDPKTPLRKDTIAKDSFCGLLPLDRWLVDPSLTDLVTDQRSLDYGKPKYYTTVGDTPLPPSTRIHHTRFIRFDGVKLPYYQRLSENLWDMSVLEPLWDRLMSFDMTTASTAQLVNRASVRKLFIEKWKETVGTGGDLLAAQLQAIDFLRFYQQNEGISILDANDRMESDVYSFTGLDAVLIQMGQQISGALGIPLVRLFGQSPVGLNSTGESDIRNYYDMIKSQQERKFRRPVDGLIEVVAKSLGIKIPNGFDWHFNPLWQLQEIEKVQISSGVTQQVLQAFEAGVITDQALIFKELKSQSQRTGVWTNITDEMIDQAEHAPPLAPPGAGAPGAGGPGGEGMPPEPSFLPGGGSSGAPKPTLPKPGGQDEESFLPGGSGRQTRSSFLPGGMRTILGAGGEKASDDDQPQLPFESPHRTKKPIFHVYTSDQDQPPKRTTTYAGFEVCVECEEGDQRHVGSSGGATMLAPYGYFPGTVANDGDCLDVFLGPHESSNRVFVIDTCEPGTKKYHQPKVFLGWGTGSDVLKVFNGFYADNSGPERFLGGKEYTLGDFRQYFQNFVDARKAV
jgi:phage-related protein (TIGR01555 family)